MDRQEEILKQTLDVLDRRERQGDYASLFEIAKIMKEVQPDISFLEYKSIIKSLAKRMGKRSDGVFIPDGFNWFSKSFVNAIRPAKVLIPFALGLECDWFNDEINVEYHFLNKNYEKATALITNIKTIEEIPEEGKYDLIISALPLGLLSSSFISCQIVEQSSELLSDDGFCVFTFAKNITRKAGDEWLSGLENKGLFCSAIFDMPMGSYAPISAVESVVVVFSKKKAKKRFVGLLENNSSIDKNVENFLKGKASANSAKLGIYVEGDTKCYSDYYRAFITEKRNKLLAKAYNGEVLMLEEIGDVHAPNKKGFQESEYAVYVPKYEKGLAVTDTADFNIKVNGYYQVVVNTDRILPRFLAFFLNTEEGMNQRQLLSTGVSIKTIDKEMLEKIMVPCPSVEAQAEYLKTYDQLEALRVQLETIKNKLEKTPASYKNIRKEIKDINNTGDKFAQWIETLPYPIATILKRYSVAEDANTKQETLFYFYEAYAIFQATLLSAAWNKKLIDHSKIDVDPAYFEKASFGNWVRMDRALSNMFLSMINSPDDEKKNVARECFKTFDDNLIKLLCNKSACNILESASMYRNSWKGHSGITSDVLYKDHVDTLDSMLHKFHESIKDLYERVRLVRPISLSFSKDIFSNKVEVLTGSNPIFTKDTVKLLIPLDDSKLYFQLLDTGEMLELPPYFIMKNTPADVKNACYFYSRVEKGNTRYVSYHYDGRPEDIETGEVAYSHIKSLLTH